MPSRQIPPLGDKRRDNPFNHKRAQGEPAGQYLLMLHWKEVNRRADRSIRWTMPTNPHRGSILSKVPFPIWIALTPLVYLWSQTMFKNRFFEQEKDAFPAEYPRDIKTVFSRFHDQLRNTGDTMWSVKESTIRQLLTQGESKGKKIANVSTL